MKKLFRNMLFMAILFFCLTAPTSGKSVEIKSNLYFSENPIKFEPPMIKVDNVVFVPIRSLVSYFDGEITQSKKDYIYKITIQNNILKFKENVKEYTFNNSPKKFNLKPIKYKTRLYVPLAQLLRNLNYNISEKNNHYYAFATENMKKEPNKAQSIKFNYIYPRLSNDINSIYLPISKIDIPLKKIIHKNKDYVDLSKFLNYLGYKISIIEKNILLKKKNDIYAFKNNSKTVKINSNNKIIEKKLSHAPVLKKETPYFHLSSFLNDLGFSYHIQGNKIIIIKKLHSISFQENKIILSKNSQIRLSNGNHLSNPNRLYWDLPFTDCPDQNINIQSTYVKRVTFGESSTTCRMVAYLNSNYKGTINKISKTKTKITLIKQPKVARKIAVIKSKSLRGKVIIIDPGHGGRDPGAVTKNNDFEKYYTLDISKRIKKHVEKHGAKAILLRNSDTNPSLYQRVLKTNRLNGDFLISVHVNSFINSKANGTETYYYKKSEKLAAKKIQNQLVNYLGLKNNGIKFAKMYILKNTSIPGVLIEPCFMTNPSEYKKLKQVTFREKIAIGTVAGLNDYFKNK